MPYTYPEHTPTQAGRAPLARPPDVPLPGSRSCPRRHRPADAEGITRRDKECVVERGILNVQLRITNVEGIDSTFDIRNSLFDIRNSIHLLIYRKTKEVTP